VSARMILLGGGAADETAAAGRAREALMSGRALDTFARMVERHGGNPRIVDDPSLLAAAPDREAFRASRAGFVTRLRAGLLGRASNALGAGRDTVGDPVDHAVGLRVLARPGDAVRAGQPLIELHHRQARGLAAALRFCGDAVTIGDAAPPGRPAVIDQIR
jgi:pyrimidine-nucleoside phosphorylase